MKLIKKSKLFNKQLSYISASFAYAKKIVILSIALAITSVPATSWSGNPVLAKSPLFMENNVQPNIFFMLDDSGSMGWEVLMTSSATNLHGGNPNSGNVDLTPDNQAERLELCYSYNALAYNPAYPYESKIWQGKDSAGTDYAVMTNYTAVRNNPYNPAGTFDLTAAGIIAYFPWTDANTNGQYEVGECGANIGADNSDGITFASLSAAQKLRFANWYSYYRKRDYVMKYALGEVIFPSQHRMGLGSLWNRNGVGTPIKDVDNFTVPLNAAAVANKSALLDSVGKITPGSTTPLRQKLQDVGEYYDGTGNAALFGAAYNHTDTFNSSSPILNATKGGECQQNFTFLMTDGFWNGGAPSPSLGNTDTDGAFAFDGGLYADTYSNTLADVAMHYYENDLAPALADLVPKDESGRFNADLNEKQHMVTYTVAFGLKGQIRETFTGANPGDGAFPGWPSPFAGATDKTRIDDVWHAAFNGRGLYLNAADPEDLIDQFGEVLRSINARAGAAAGVSITSGTISSKTRIYQTKFNSGDWSGQLLAYKFDATNTIVPALDFAGDNDARTAIEAQITINLDAPDDTDARTILTYNGTKGVPFRYDSASALSADTITAAQVTALVDGDITGGGLPDNAKAERRVNYLRGDHFNEEVNSTLSDGVTINPNAVFRTRDRNPDEGVYTPFVLGDSVHSSPLYVGAPPFAYPDFLEGPGNEYYKFRLNYFDRTPMVYFGANDGMLHGVEVTPPDPVTLLPAPGAGKERIAYVPAALYSKLPALTSKYYTHQYYVDESPAVGDVFYNTDWHTVLVGALRGGGQGIFTLDITDPSVFSEATPGEAAASVLWEFTDADDPDMGYTFGRPNIVKMQNGRWYAVFGNGYNNTEVDSATSATGNAVLYIVDIETKAMTKVDTGIGMATSADGSHPNGLAKPAVVDYDGDYKVDYIFAGDLQGNMHKFDVTGNSPASWRNASKRSILFTAVDSFGVGQPITSQPEIDLAPAGPKGLIVIFGTGQYLEKTDITSTQPQTMYGIWDQSGYSGAATVNVTRGDLVTQTLTNTTDAFGRELRSLTDIVIEKWGNGGGTGEYMGWQIDLPETAERVITNPTIQDDKVVFISITPNEKPCDPGGKSWFMVFDLENGGRTSSSVIDVNEDDEISEADLDINSDVVSGTRHGSLILGTDIVINDDAVLSNNDSTVGQKCASAASSKVITSDSKGDLGTRTLSRPQNAFRQGWRQLQ